MPIEIICSSCSSSFRVAEQFAGKRVKCPKCSVPLAIPCSPPTTAIAPEAADTNLAVPSPPMAPPIGTPPAAAPRVPRGERSSRQYHWSVVAGAAIAAVILGYFLGREHVKYERRSALTEAGNAFADALKESFGGNAPEEKLEAMPVIKPVDEQLDAVEFDQPITAPDFQLSLVAVRVDRPKLRDLFGQTVLAKSPDLVIILKVANTHDRKILRYREESAFLSNNFELRDDVDNRIRGVSYPAGETPIGALSGDQDILPGMEATHLQPFSVPPPKTKHLILTVDLGAFGGSGKASFKIPADRIANFTR